MHGFRLDYHCRNYFRYRCGYRFGSVCLANQNQQPLAFIRYENARLDGCTGHD